MEEILLGTLALCVDPQKQAASGVSKRAIRAYGIGVTHLSDEERRIRQALKEELLRKAKP